jgi:hypothetical protein
MKAFLALGLLAVSAPVARAQEVACSIRVLEAPAEVSEALVGWASGEKICHALDVRITPTADGYALWAQADDGRTFTRSVSDAKTAALLVVSWAGDDTLPAADPPARYTITSHVRQVVPQPTAIASHSAPPAREENRAIVVMAVANPGRGEDLYARTGLRASIDLTTNGLWVVGVAGMLTDEKVNIYDNSTGYRYAQAYEPRATLMGYIGRWAAHDHLRFSAGAGLSYSQLSDVAPGPGTPSQMFERVGVTVPALELSLLAWIPMSGRWAFTGGVVITASEPSSTYDLLKNSNHAFAPHHDAGVQIVGALGVGRSL